MMIFPSIAFRIIDSKSISLETFLRKFNTEDGKWWLVKIRYTYSGGHSDLHELTMCYNRILHTAHRTQLYGIVAPDMKDLDGEAIFTLDPKQYSEHGRLYMEDDLLFPKDTRPVPQIGVSKEVTEELQVLWDEYYAKYYKPINNEEE